MLAFSGCTLWNACVNTRAGAGEERRMSDKGCEEGEAVTAPPENNTGFPSTLFVCLLPLFMKFIRNWLSFPAYHTCFFKSIVHPRMSFVGWANEKEGQLERENIHGGSETVELLYQGVYLKWTSPCINYTPICHYATAKSQGDGGHGVSACFWYFWDSSSSFRFGWNLPLDLKFGVSQVCWKNHGHKEKTWQIQIYIHLHTADDGLFFLKLLGWKWIRLEVG